jgi:DNA-binding transcriptional LysR family regulator
MTSARILRALYAYLQPLCAAAQGDCELSGTPQHTLSLLRAGPSRWRLIIQWQNERQVSQSSASTLTFIIVVQQAKGLAALPGADVANDRAGDPALLERLEQAITWVRAAKLKHPQIDPRDMNPKAAQFIVDPESPTRQAMAEFSLVYGRDAVEDVTVAVP